MRKNRSTAHTMALPRRTAICILRWDASVRTAPDRASCRLRVNSGRHIIYPPVQNQVHHADKQKDHKEIYQRHGRGIGKIDLAGNLLNILEHGVGIIDKIVDNDGNVVEQNTRTELGRVASKETTDKIKDLMESVVLEGTGSVYNMEGYGLIAKTGTAQISSTDGTGYLTGESDVIRGFAGMFPKEDPEIIIYANLKRPTPNTPNALVSVIKEVVENVSKYYHIYDADEPVTTTDNTYTLENYQNKDVASVKATLEKNGLTVVTIGNGDRIINQYPNKNITLNKGSKVFLVTNGTKYTIPDMTLWSKKDVTTYLNYTNIDYQTTGDGYLTSQSIPAGTEYIAGQMTLALTFAPKYNTNE